MNIELVAPAAPRSRAPTGNEVTAGRWARLLEALGHRVSRSEAYDGGEADLLIALHARRSAASIQRFAATHPQKPRIVAVTGTDLYVDYPEDPDVCRSFELATRLVVLQEGALEHLGPHRGKTEVILQSAEGLPPLEKAEGLFQVCLLAHLREVKDPLLVLQALVRLPASSRIRVVHGGEALSPALGKRALEASRTDPRYRWLGPLSHQESRLLIGRSHLMILTSRAEGAGNVLSESLAIGVPILAADARGVEGFLGADFPGLFPVGDASALATVLSRAETEPGFYQALEAAGRRLAPRVAPARERKAWASLLAELACGSNSP